jgi:CheY-like chemotaxis protein
MKALIVDDCQLTRELLGLAIDSSDTVTYAQNGVEAVKLVTEAVGAGNHFDLICLDIHMPVMGGLEALRIIRSIETDAGVARAKAFMITSSTSPEHMIEAITVGECDDYLTKPVIKSAFMELLRKHNLFT